MQVAIEKMIYGGDGLGHLPADAKGRGKAVFIPFVLPGERVEARVVETRPGFARAKLDRVLTPAVGRAKPVCQYFTCCGGCHYQHANYDAQLRFKADTLRETLRRIAKVELEQEIQLHPSEPWAYRNRTRMRLRHEPRFELGYHGYNSYHLLAVEQCPISSSLINQAIAATWKIGRQGRIPKSIHGLQFFANEEDRQVLVEAYVQPGGATKDWEQFASRLRAAVPQVVGVVESEMSAAGESDQHGPLSAENSRPFRACGSESLTYCAAGHPYRVSAGSFFQTNRFLVDELVRIVAGRCSGKAALELYAGVGLFTVPLADSFEDVIAVEASPRSFGDLRVNGQRNVQPIRATTEKFLAGHTGKSNFDLVLLDPPRAGLGKKSARTLGHMSVSRVTYISCDPATLARDLRVLLECGFRVEQAHLVDLFPQTFHMETVLYLVR